MRNAVAITALAALLGVAACAPQQAGVGHATVQAIYMACGATHDFTTPQPLAVERCASPKADALYAQYRDRDLIDVYYTSRIEIAERLDAHKITEAEAQRELSVLRSQMISEWDSRVDRRTAIMLMSP